MCGLLLPECVICASKMNQSCNDKAQVDAEEQRHSNEANPFLLQTTNERKSMATTAIEMQNEMMSILRDNDDTLISYCAHELDGGLATEASIDRAHGK